MILQIKQLPGIRHPMKGYDIMWGYLSSLPNTLSVTILILGILAIVIISLKGTAVFRWGKNIIGLGKAKVSDSQDSVETTEDPGVPPSTVMIKHPKRGCGDCILIIMGEREKYELKMSGALNHVLKNQMNFVEQKLTDIQALFTNMFMEQINKINAKVNEDSYEAQYKLYYGLLRDCLITIKDEFRRSLKENGFSELSEVEFSFYVKNKARNILSIMSQHTRNFYPTRGVVVGYEKILDNIEKRSNDIQDILLSIYMNAKQVVIETDKEINRMKIEYSQWVDNFIK